MMNKTSVKKFFKKSIDKHFGRVYSIPQSYDGDKVGSGLTIQRVPGRCEGHGYVNLKFHLQSCPKKGFQPSRTEPFFTRYSERV